MARGSEERRQRVGDMRRPNDVEQCCDVNTREMQPWTCHGLHESWQGRCQESFRIHGQPASAEVGDASPTFL